MTARTHANDNTPAANTRPQPTLAQVADRAIGMIVLMNWLLNRRQP
jgi:hypothetical protein